MGQINGSQHSKSVSAPETFGNMPLSAPYLMCNVPYTSEKKASIYAGCFDVSRFQPASESEPGSDLGVKVPWGPRVPGTSSRTAIVAP